MDSCAKHVTEEKTMTKNKRNTLLINRTFQFRLIIKFVILNTAIMAIFGFLMYLFLNSEIDSNLRSAHVTYQNLKDMLFPIILTLSLINILFSSFAIAIFTLIASHRIAGPQFRFLQTLMDIKERDLTTSRDIREEDQFQTSSEALNNAVGIIRNDLSVLQDCLEKIMAGHTDNLTDGQKELLKKGIETVNRYTL